MYNKLYAKIVHSSIWLSPDPHRIAWITFLALMDQDGFVNLASPANLAHVARLSLEDAQTAVHAFESPDPHDPGQEYEGRRIERVPGGYMVLNAARYREMATAEQIRQRTRTRVAEHRLRQKTGFNNRFKVQDGKCDCCGKGFEEPYSLYVVLDHNHETGAERALVCQSCNKVIGLVEAGSRTTSPKSEICAAYLRRHGNAPVTPSVSETETNQRTKTVKATRKSPPEWFLEFKAIFPRRAGDPNWAGGLRAANQRLSEGHTPQELIGGARRYAAYIEATKRQGTDYIQQASRFLGPGKPFLLPWNAPAEAESDWDQMMRLNGGKDNGSGRVFEGTEPSGTALAAPMRPVRG